MVHRRRNVSILYIVIIVFYLKQELMINKEFFEGPVGDICIASNTIKCLLLHCSGAYHQQWPISLSDLATRWPDTRVPVWAVQYADRHGHRPGQSGAGRGPYQVREVVVTLDWSMWETYCSKEFQIHFVTTVLTYCSGEIQRTPNSKNNVDLIIEDLLFYIWPLWGHMLFLPFCCLSI